MTLLSKHKHTLSQPPPFSKSLEKTSGLEISLSGGSKNGRAGAAGGLQRMGRGRG